MMEQEVCKQEMQTEKGRNSKTWDGDQAGMQAEMWCRRKTVTGTDRNRVKERGAGSRRQEEARAWVGWGHTKETEREKEANQSPERVKDSRRAGPSLLTASVPGWVLASSEPLLKLLHVGA